MKINLKIFLILVLINNNTNSQSFDSNKNYLDIKSKQAPIFKKIKCDKSIFNNNLDNLIWDLQVILGYTIGIAEKLSLNRDDIYSKSNCINFQRIASESMHEIALFKFSLSLPEICSFNFDSFTIENSIRKIERYELIKHLSRLINKISKTLPNRYRYRDHHARRLQNIVLSSEKYIMDLSYYLKQKNVNEFIRTIEEYINKLIEINSLIK